MRCPICGAKCRCRNRGEDGQCCPCHKHKARAKKLGISFELFVQSHERQKSLFPEGQNERRNN